MAKDSQTNKSKQPDSGPVNVKRLATRKRLPPNHLRLHGFSDCRAGIRIDYEPDLDGTPARARIRPNLTAKDCFWDPGNDLRIIPYGVLEANRLAHTFDWCAIGEGETCGTTCRYHGVPFIGIPGATMYRKLRLEHVERFARIYLIQESDDAGRRFATEHLPQHLADIGYKGEIHIIKMPAKYKDLSGIHMADPGRFDQILTKLRTEATPAPTPSNPLPKPRKNDRGPLDLETAADIDAVDLEQLLDSEIGEADRRGKRLCCFHDDHTPSLTTYKDKSGRPRWKCWACGAGGDAVDFIRKRHNLTFPEALDRLNIDRFQSELPEITWSTDQQNTTNGGPLVSTTLKGSSLLAASRDKRGPESGDSSDWETVWHSIADESTLKHCDTPRVEWMGPREQSGAMKPVVYPCRDCKSCRTNRTTRRMWMALAAVRFVGGGFYVLKVKTTADKNTALRHARRHAKSTFEEATYIAIAQPPPGTVRGRDPKPGEPEPSPDGCPWVIFSKHPLTSMPHPQLSGEALEIEINVAITAVMGVGGRVVYMSRNIPKPPEKRRQYRRLRDPGGKKGIAFQGEQANIDTAMRLQRWRREKDHSGFILGFENENNDGDDLEAMRAFVGEVARDRDKLETELEREERQIACGLEGGHHYQDKIADDGTTVRVCVLCDKHYGRVRPKIVPNDGSEVGKW